MRDEDANHASKAVGNERMAWFGGLPQFEDMMVEGEKTTVVCHLTTDPGSSICSSAAFQTPVLYVQAATLRTRGICRSSSRGRGSEGLG